MSQHLIDPSDPPQRQTEKLMTIATALMRRVEQMTDDSGAAYAQFERATLLEDQVRNRTRDLEHALDLLNESNARLSRAHAETRAARDDLRAAIEGIEEGFALFSPDNHLVLANSRFCALLAGIPAQMLPGLTFEAYVDMVARAPELVLEDGVTVADWVRQRLRRHTERHVSFNVRLKGDFWLQVSEHRTPDGGTVILQTDVSNIMRHERQTRGRLIDDQAQMLQATLDNLAQGVVIFDAAGRLVGSNARLAQMLDVGPLALGIGMSFSAFLTHLTPMSEADRYNPIARLYEWFTQQRPAQPIAPARPPLHFETQMHRANHASGQDVVILAGTGRQMPDGGVVLSLSDVTLERAAARSLYEANEVLEARVVERTSELENALQSAERANASKTRFVAAASHDLLQPLSAARLYVEALLDEPARLPPQNVANVAAKAQAALGSVEAMIEALLDISKLDAGTEVLEKGPVALGAILRRLGEEFAPKAALKGLDLRVVGCDAMVISNHAFLTRIIQNLMANAIRYTDHGKVLVGVRRTTGGLRLEVWDTGPGIAAQDHAVIFDEFHRLDRRASASEGLGLGLAIVKRACGRLDHALDLWSEPGRGSGFFVNLALADQPAGTPDVPRSAPLPRGLGGSGMIVLLVENDLELRRALTLVLTNWHVDVLAVGTAREALELLREIEIAPDAMLIDYQLDDGVTGLELLADLRGIQGDVPTRIISANRGAELRAACQKAGVDLLAKPIEPQALERFLRAAIEGVKTA